MSEWKETTLSEIATYTTGKLNSNAEVENGVYPFFTCSPTTLQIDNYAFDTEALILAGNNANGVFSLKYYNGKFNAYQRTYIISIKDLKETDYKFLYYSLKIQLSNLEIISHGTATKYLTLPILNQIPVLFPSLPEQRAIASVLSSLDDKIDLLHRQNKTLEAMAETLFRQWFVEEVNEGWERGKVKDLFILQRGFDLPAQSRIDGNYPVISSSGINGYHNEYKIQSPGVTTGRSGLLGQVFYIMDNFWPLNTSLFIVEYKLAKPLFAYFFLKTLDLAGLNGGSAVPTLNRNDVHILETSLPNSELINEFERISQPMFKKIKDNTIQIRTLEKIRDTLLPKLMTGEVRVEL